MHSVIPFIIDTSYLFELASLNQLSWLAVKLLFVHPGFLDAVFQETWARLRAALRHPIGRPDTFPKQLKLFNRIGMEQE